MCVEQFLMEHKIWLEVLTAFGTVGATIVALYLAIKSARSTKQEILSGLKITEPDDDGVAYLENTTRIELCFDGYKSDDLLDHSAQNSHYRNLCTLSALKQINWKGWKEGMVLAPGERTALHLKNLRKEETFVALSAIKVALRRKTRYWVFRYAGDKAKQSRQLSDETHPHLKWVLEFSGIG